MKNTQDAAKLYIPDQGMFTREELDLFLDYSRGRKIRSDNMEEWIAINLRYKDHVEACNKYGIVGVGCFRYYRN